jgi:hypothetical protein
MLWIVLFFYFSFSSAIIVYNNANFKPNNINLILNTISQVYSQMDCACLCFTNTTCLTVTYFGIAQSCILFSVPLQYGTLSLMTTDQMASVSTFPNKTLPGKRLLTGRDKYICKLKNSLKNFLTQIVHETVNTYMYKWNFFLILFP